MDHDQIFSRRINPIYLMENIKTIAVAGAGAMGAGIAQVFAQAGYAVRLFDLNPAQLDKAKSDIAANLTGAVSKGKLSEQEKNNTISNIQATSIR